MKTTTIKNLLFFTVLLLCACDGGGGGADSNQAPAIAPALPDSEVNNAAADLPLEKKQAFRLLEQASFGPTLESIEGLAGSSADAWINEQMAQPATYLSDGLRRSNNSEQWNEYVNVWWRQTIYAPDQLRQRIAFALSEIFVISASDGLGDEQAGLANYYDILLRNSFGNYRQLIEEITLNPIMGEFLSMKGNRKPEPEKNIRPDENYARELLQLFSIGLSMLNTDGSEQTDAEGIPIPTYMQDTVEAFAHVFTGWHFANAEDFRWPKNKDFINPMKAWPEFHDTGEKTLLNGVVLPAGQSAEQDMKMALDNIANHPNVGPFIVKQLIKRLVTSNPSPGYIKDVVAVFNSNADGERGNLGSTVKAILMHKEAREGHLDKPHTFGKLKEPLIKLTQLWRAFQPDMISDIFNYSWVNKELQQSPLGAPSVFNFFTPDFAQPGDIRNSNLVSPEFEIMDESSIVTLTSRLLSNTLWAHNYKVPSTGKRIVINIDREMQLEPDRDALLNHLNLLLLGGRMSPELREEAMNLMAERDYSNGASQRVAEAIYLIITSPESMVQL